LTFLSAAPKTKLNNRKYFIQGEAEKTVNHLLHTVIATIITGLKLLVQEASHKVTSIDCKIGYVIDKMMALETERLGVFMPGSSYSYCSRAPSNSPSRSAIIIRHRCEGILCQFNPLHISTATFPL
jgi:hypothetical protein